MKRKPNFLIGNYTFPASANGMNKPVFKPEREKKSSGVRSHDDFPNIQNVCHSEPSRSGSCQIRMGIPSPKLGTKKYNHDLLPIYTSQHMPMRRTAPKAKT